ncbi:MAG TPA: hypothetical protein VHQ46_02360 [Desulfobacteria bacterium]|nr:hypothetical protein [Desulfobacteria bacterium]
METDSLPYRALVAEYFSITRRINAIISTDSRELREFAENLVCNGI